MPDVQIVWAFAYALYQTPTIGTQIFFYKKQIKMTQKFPFQILDGWIMLLMLFLLIDYQGFAKYRNIAAKPDHGFIIDDFSLKVSGRNNRFVKAFEVRSRYASQLANSLHHSRYRTAAYYVAKYFEEIATKAISITPRISVLQKASFENFLYGFRNPLINKVFNLNESLA
ncbi:hypothetical protein OQZ29_01865 [Pedobacter agri]|uniref:Uncharacterized protein n=2 Tax=Pedobacter agri TaxID=454586 RepID=A0A9X3DA52_9SPHI|nr:hypothetical protein [Pedobacter agri]MCX3263469.1 hypothetical protein [Pedobacter agri]